MSDPKATAASSTGAVEFVSFVAGGQNFCIQITQIREIRRWAPVTMLPHSPNYVLGVINLRGAVIPIVDLACRLGFPQTEASERHVIIMTSLGERVIGLLVDSVSEVISASSDMRRETPQVPQDESRRYISGLIAQDEGMTRIVDIEALMPPVPGAAA